MIATIPVGNSPQGVAYDPDNGEVYVTNNATYGSVSVINASTHQNINTITVGNHPLGVAYDPDNGEVYVANEGSGSVSVIATLPIANAGSNQTVQSSETVHLYGSASSDPSVSPPLTYNWTQVSGPSVSLSNSNTATPSFVAPNANQETTFTFQLVVTNSAGVHSNPSFVTITVTPSSSPTPSNQNGSSIINSNVNSFDNNGHNTYLNHQSQNSYNLQNPMCLTVFGSCDANSGR